MSDLKFEIVKELGVIGEGTKGWAKEVNLVSWNDRKPKFDIRDWNETHEKMGKGVTLSKEEAKKLLELLRDFDFNEMD
ncbi:MAG: PC4/YdbC family ssDNA-binding protein [Oscillospiraceae bacterium]|nr:PC4/YdbC family ssDNA-binding protein [Oscillospiraceae bacterium]